MDIIELIKNECHIFHPENNYWLVRTDGGYLYNLFKENNLIAIGYPEFSLEEIERAMKVNRSDENGLFKLATKKIKEHSRPGFIVSQINRFFNEIKINDYVLIPDSSTNRLSIGIVQESEVKFKDLFKINRDNQLSKVEGYNKTKKVRWLKEVSKNFIDPNLYSLFFTHQTIVNANDYANLINSMLYGFYKYYDNYHIVFELNKKDIPALNLFQSFYEVLRFSQEFTAKLGIDESINDVKLSVHLSSPGKMELFGKTMVILFIAGAIVVGINGGGFKLKSEKFDIDTEISTPGLIHNLNQFLNSGVDRELKRSLEEKIDSLDIKDPDAILKMLSEINKKNQND